AAASTLPTLSLPDALPISAALFAGDLREEHVDAGARLFRLELGHAPDHGTHCRRSSTVISRGSRAAAINEVARAARRYRATLHRSEEHTSELQSHLNLVCR